MADFFSENNAYQGTFTPGTVEVDPVFQICAVSNLNASNEYELSFWANKNGQRVDSDLGTAAYRLRDKSGALVSGISETGILPDVNGYFHTDPVSAALIYDLTHYLLEIEIDVDGVEISSSLGLVVGK